LGLVKLFDDSAVEAAAVLRTALAEAGEEGPVRAEILLWLGWAELNAGQLDEAYQHAIQATELTRSLGLAPLFALAESGRVLLDFFRGSGFDVQALSAARAVEGPSQHVPLPLRPSAHEAMLRAMTGELDFAAEQLGALRQDCIDRGQENELFYIELHSVLVEVWRGNLGTAAAIADTAHERALLLDRDVPRAVALLMRGLTSAWSGSPDRAREACRHSQAMCTRIGLMGVAVWPPTAWAMLELSAGRPEAALAAHEPLLGATAPLPRTAEIFTAPYVPEAVEALVMVGRLEEAQQLLTPFEHAASRLDRAWALATGGRSRALLLAARGDLDGAVAAAEQAMVEHERLPMPLERARTQLVLGGLQRRRRKREAAAAVLDEAWQAFDSRGATLWAARARTELDRLAARSAPGVGLTPSEQRVADLVAAGRTNREVAAELFISLRTVEANVATVYRKLGIRSRAELGRLMSTRHGDAPVDDDDDDDGGAVRAG
jgi:DNA-binding CsgD family transcriptional regulator